MSLYCISSENGTGRGELRRATNAVIITYGTMRTNMILCTTQYEFVRDKNVKRKI